MKKINQEKHIHWKTKKMKMYKLIQTYYWLGIYVQTKVGWLSTNPEIFQALYLSEISAWLNFFMSS